MRHIKNGINSDKVTVFDCNLYALEKNMEAEGNLTYVYNNIHIPFDANESSTHMISPAEKLEVLMLTRNVTSS